MYDEICTLLKMESSIAPNGDPIEFPESGKEVFCRIYSANDKEKQYVAAVTRGKRAERVVEIADRMDYDEEMYVLIGGRIYEVLDTKWNDVSDSIKLVVGRWDYR